MKLSTSFFSLLALVPLAWAQQQVWGQCGGIGWTGATTCVSGSTCVVSNSYYSQCIPSTSAPTSSSAGGGGGTPTSTASGGGGTSTVGLNSAAKSAGKKYFGTASDTSEFQADAAYAAILADTSEFGQLSPLNSMKWDSTEPEQGTFTFTEGDLIVAEAKANGQIMRGHNLVWYNELPSWVTSGNFNASALTSIIQTHASTEVSHFAGDIHAWDVINEPFNDDGTWRSDVFYDTLGSSFISIALNAARPADPNAKLYINEYNLEYTGPKATAMIDLIQSLKSAGVPIDGVGFEGHFIVGEVSTSMQSVMEQVTALGVEVAITELDIRMTLPSTTALLAQQQTDYQTAISQCNAVSGCIGATVWDFTDKYSWVPSTFSGQGDACPWDSNLEKKPAYDGIVAGFQ
ncbi:endo-1,4-beta-xylanase A precursor [Phellopilus nigrolimitatus]|nr:endo-1,4-beta-xylanase A precursor [Phellopilus nigrolimitatus]